MMDEKIIEPHIDAWNPVGIADCDVHEYDIESRAICSRLSDNEVITLGALTKIIHDVFVYYFSKDIFSRKNTFAETRTVAEKILADLKAQGYKVSDDYEISAEEELERVQLEESQILTETYRDREVNANVPFTFRLFAEMFFCANRGDGKEIAEKILAAYDTPEKILQAGQERVYEIIRAYRNIKSAGKRFFETSKFLAETCGGKLPATFAEFLTLPNLDANVGMRIEDGLIKNSDADFGEHVLRVANRTKLAAGRTLFEVQRGLREFKGNVTWRELFWHGREFCTEHEPRCAICPLSKICPSGV